MKTYKAIKNVTIGAGGITNTNKAAKWYLSNRFLIGDTAELSEAQAKQYAVYFSKVKTIEKEKPTETNKKKDTAKNK